MANNDDTEEMPQYAKTKVIFRECGLFVLMLYIPVNKFSVMSGCVPVFLG